VAPDARRGGRRDNNGPKGAAETVSGTRLSVPFSQPGQGFDGTCCELRKVFMKRYITAMLLVGLVASPAAANFPRLRNHPWFGHRSHVSGYAPVGSYYYEPVVVMPFAPVVPVTPVAPVCTPVAPPAIYVRPPVA